MMCKGYDNVWLNLAWTHIISQKMSINAMEEIIDTLPLNKILGFSGDYKIPVENVYGHLEMARENIAKILSGQIIDGKMTENDTIYIASLWLNKNPKDIYKI